MLQLLVIIHNDLDMPLHTATSNEQWCRSMELKSDPWVSVDWEV
jgi:hypothetical protein